MKKKHDATPDSSTIRPCITCNQPWPKDLKLPGYFSFDRSHPPNEPPDLTEILERNGDTEALVSYIKALFEAMFCVWKCESERPGDVDSESIRALTDLGRLLCEETERSIDRAMKVGFFWHDQYQHLAKEGQKTSVRKEA